MSIERSMVSAKLEPANVEFLDEWGRHCDPYEVSLSCLINLSVGIVRNMYIQGKLNLAPKALQILLRTEGPTGLEDKRSRRS